MSQQWRCHVSRWRGLKRMNGDDNDGEQNPANLSTDRVKPKFRLSVLLNQWGSGVSARLCFALKSAKLQLQKKKIVKADHWEWGLRRKQTSCGDYEALANRWLKRTNSAEVKCKDLALWSDLSENFSRGQMTLLWRSINEGNNRKIKITLATIRIYWNLS